ncbi:hypothetical protein E4U14_003647 [Claviceps sp. LM454 group G7]|nr:hypothetical protein E4U14_003647 [Claviceps sp. LM454 group G7]
MAAEDSEDTGTSRPTPTGANSYQVNINRTKTKKWVEAKVQNYDGDDWGADEYDDDDDDEPELAPEPATAGPAVRTTGTRDSSLPSLRARKPIASEYSQRSARESAVIRPDDAEAITQPSNVSGQMRESSDLSTPKAAFTPGHVKSDSIGSIGRDENFNATSVINSTEYNDGDDGHQRLLSASPKLPDVPRMSTFGSNLFPSSRESLSARKSVGETFGGVSSPPATTKHDVVLSSSDSDTNLTAGQTLASKPFEEDKEDAGIRHSANQEAPATEIISPVPSKFNSPVDVEKAGSESPTADPALKAMATPSKDKDSALHADVIAPLRTPSPRAPLRPIPPADAPEAETTPSKKDSSATQIGHDSGLHFVPGSVQRQATFNTDTSSPVKDNDFLSDEILKSLSLSASPTETSNDQFTSKGSQLPGRTGTNDSNNTSQDDDDSWEEDSEKDAQSSNALANIDPIPELSGGQDVSAGLTAESPAKQSAQSLVPPQSSTLRARFSWEAEERAAQLQPRTSSLPFNAASAAVQAGRGVGETASLTEETLRPIGLSPQVSNGSSQPAARQQSAFEASNLVSSALENESPAVGEANDLTAPEDNALDQRDLTAVSPTPLSDNDPAASGVQLRPNSAHSTPSIQQPQAQAMSFRDIMKLGSSGERIAKYNESREIAALTESGLENWLVHMSTEYPDMTLDGPFQNASGFAPGSSAAAQAGLSSPAFQQPQHQQVLNAGTANSASSPTSRGRLASLGMPSPVSGSTFGHSGNQIGTKSKELMHSAGKMGKGLLSKGRSKLRGTGDKGEAAPPPSDDPTSTTSTTTTTKIDRRKSWGVMMSLGASMRSRGDGDAPPSHHAKTKSKTKAKTKAEVIAANATCNTEQAEEAMAPQIPQSLPPSGRASRATAGLSRLQIPRTGSRVSPGVQSAPLSSMSCSWGAGNDTSAVIDSTEESLESEPSRFDDSRPYHSFMGLPPIRRGSTFALTSMTKARRAVDRFPIDDDDDDDDDEVEVEVEREEEEEEEEEEGEVKAEEEEEEVIEDGEREREGKHEEQGMERERGRDAEREREQEQERLPESATLARAIDMALDGEATLQAHPRASYSSQEPTLLAMPDLHGHGVTYPERSTDFSKDIVTDFDTIIAKNTQLRDMEKGQHQRPAPNLGPPTQNARDITTHTNASLPPPIVNPSQRLPASGPWRLEESKLTVPPTPVAKYRAVTDAPSDHFMYGFDKEISMLSPDSATLEKQDLPIFQAPTQLQFQEQVAYQSAQAAAQHSTQTSMGPHSFRHASDVPPSSAQRWPELFACAPDEGALSGLHNGHQGYQGPFESQPHNAPYESQSYHAPQEFQPHDAPYESQPYHEPYDSQHYRPPQVSQPYNAPYETQPYHAQHEPQPYNAPNESRPYHAQHESQPYNARYESQPHHAPQESLAAHKEETMMPRYQENEYASADAEPLSEERGRTNRNFGALKDFGQKLARAASRDRLADMDRREQRQTGQEIRGEGASEMSIVTGSEYQDQRNHRNRFFPARSGRMSAGHQEPRNQAGGAGRDDESLQGSRPPSAPPRASRRSTFGAGLGGKLVSSGLATSSRPNAAQGVLAHSQTFHEAQSTAPDNKKKRFSGLAKTLNRFSRHKQEERPASTEQPRATLEPLLEPPAPPFQRLGHRRASTTSSFETGSQHLPTDRDPVRRGARRPPSVSGLISSMLGRRPPSNLGQGEPTGSGQQASLQRPGSEDQVLSRDQVSDQHQDLPFVLPHPLELFPASAPPTRGGEADGMRFPSLAMRPAQTSRPSSRGVVAPLPEKGRDLGVGCQDTAPAGDYEPRPPPQDHHHYSEPISEPIETSYLPAYTDQNYYDPPDALGQFNTAVAGEWMRPFTVSPELSTASDWASTRHHTAVSQDFGINSRGSGPSAMQDGNNAGIVNIQTQEAVPAEHLAREPLHYFKPNSENPPTAPLALEQQYSEYPSRGGSSSEVAYPGGNVQARMVSNPQVGGAGLNSAGMPQSGAWYVQQHQQYQPRRPEEGTSQQEQRLSMQHVSAGSSAHPSQQSLAAESHQANEGTDSKWKGLRKRMSQQMLSLGQLGSTEKKPELEKKEKGSSINEINNNSKHKILGAFKRKSKQLDAQLMAQQQQIVHPHHQPTASQSASQAGSISRSLLQGSMHAPGPESQRGSSVDGYASQQQQQAPPEPQYQQVPIPRAYHAVHGEGVTVPSAYNVGRRHDAWLAAQQQQQQQQQAAQVPPPLPQSFRAASSQQVSPPMSQSSFSRAESVSSFGMVGTAWPPQPPSPGDRRGSSRLGHNMGSPPSHASAEPGRDVQTYTQTMQNTHDDTFLPPTSNKGHFTNTRVAGNVRHHRAASNDGSGPLQRISLPPTPQPEPGTAMNKHNKAVVTKANATTAAPPRKTPLFGVDVHKANQHHDLDNLYDATPRMNINHDGKNRNTTREEYSEDHDSGATTATTKTVHAAAELEDTFGAHERRSRLAGQEDKIWCNPEDDVNFRPPMAATSYPGQEWNPYEGVDFADGKDE